MTAQLLRVAFVSLVGLVPITGCGQKSALPVNNGTDAASVTAEVDAHDNPLTEAEINALKTTLSDYHDVLKTVKDYRDAIRDAIAAGNPPEAHRPLDELDIVLGHLPIVARENNIPRSEWETINTSAQRIRELFDRVHGQIDAGEQPDFEAVAEAINRHIASLENVAAG